MHWLKTPSIFNRNLTGRGTPKERDTVQSRNFVSPVLHAQFHGLEDTRCERGGHSRADRVDDRNARRRSAHALEMNPWNRLAENTRGWCTDHGVGGRREDEKRE